MTDATAVRDPAPLQPGRGSMARGATLMVVMRAVSRVIGIGSTAVLARLLTPDDFGIVVLGSSILDIFRGLSEMSISAALIRTRAPTRDQFDTAWTMSLLRGVLMALAIVATAQPIAAAMSEPRVIPILWTLAAAGVLQSLENIRMVEFQIALDFGTVFRFQFLARIVSLVVTLGLAIVLRSYWALVISSLLTAAATTVYSYILRPHRPRLTLVAWRDLFGFSKWALATNLMSYIDAYAINLFMGWIGGARAMGLFLVSAQIASVPASEIAAPIRQPLYAGFAKLRDDLPALARSYVAGFAFLFLVITPMSLGIFLTARLITPLALGPQWTDATPIISAIVFHALFDAYAHYTGNLFIVLDRQKRMVMLTVLFLLVRVPATIWGGLSAGILGAVYGMAVTAVFGAVFWLGFSLRLIGVAPQWIIREIWRSSVACAVMVAVLLPMRPDEPVDGPIGDILLRFCIMVCVGALVHTVTLFAVWWACGRPEGAETQALGYARSASGRVSRLLFGKFRR